MEEHEFNTLKQKLDEIIGLLEIRNSLDPATVQLSGTITRSDYYIPCNCNEHTRGESTCGWYCQVHGQQF